MLLCFFFSFILQSMVYASDFNVKIDSDTKVVKPGDTIKIYVSAEGIENLRPGVNIFFATLDYDEDVFEKIDEENIVELNEWSKPTFNKENGKILMEKYNNTEENEKMFEINLTVKENVNVEETRNKYKKWRLCK